MGIELMTFQKKASALSTELRELMVSRPFFKIGSHVTHLLHSARIGSVNRFLYDD